MAILSFELAAKRLQLLRELVPWARTIAVLINSDFPVSARFQADAEAAARVIGVAIQFLQANDEAEIDGAFKSLAQTRVDALLVGPGPFLDSRRDRLVACSPR